MDVIVLQDIMKTYVMGDTVVNALDHVTVSFEKGVFIPAVVNQL